ncbi:thiol-activated cytolysin family protein [Xanthocytophaga flava]|uniref:thiol-activated cytolysin family protein n=1 Tax=Xanthocytophaga flava TaxID=3048013 RepID=UPI0028D108E7|nr:thiol-activated cytolysin family protein [Xanthocytophaga flavus]MDJ1466390.1 thiol-activated cytolysin family protein [Xanthocytophaga flavus]
MYSNLLQSRKLISGFLLVIVYFVSSCKKEETDPFTQNVSSLINSLDYDPAKLLNVQNIGNEPDKRVETGSENGSSSQSGGYITTCGKTIYTLQTNKEAITILRPLHGNIWPGALVKGNASLLDGDPDTIKIARNPVNIKIDLPGIGDNGSVTVENPSDTAIQNAVTNALNWWNANAYQEGYVNPNYTSYKTAPSYSAQQVAMDLNMNTTWANSTIASQFNYPSSSAKKVAMMVVKQGFYTASMPEPNSPAVVFGQDSDIATIDETVSKIKAVVSNEAPPAYIQTVTYGRIILFRMETSLSVTPEDVEVALQYATGVTSVSGDTETKVKNILANATIILTSVGKNAAINSRSVSARSYGELAGYINDKNSLYTIQNPGVPIQYTVRFLKDNQVARMGYTTQYTIEACTRTLVPEAVVSLTNNTGTQGGIGWDVQYTVSFKDKDNADQKLESGGIGTGSNKSVTVPAGSYKITMEAEYKDVNKWKKLGKQSWEVPTKGCFEAYGNWELFGKKEPEFRSITCQ